MDPEVGKYLAKIGRRGGQKSRRTLGTETARKMVQVREAKKAYRRFHAQCFWSYDPDYTVGLEDVGWVASQLRKHGGREAWELAEALCR